MSSTKKNLFLLYPFIFFPPKLTHLRDLIPHTISTLVLFLNRSGSKPPVLTYQHKKKRFAPNKNEVHKRNVPFTKCLKLLLEDSCFLWSVYYEHFKGWTVFWGSLKTKHQPYITKKKYHPLQKGFGSSFASEVYTIKVK